MDKTVAIFVFIVSLLTVLSVCQTEDQPKDKAKINVDEEKLSYAKGSGCAYCKYCSFCKLCDEDCPCETSKSKPNCKMCKYCKHCYLCKGFCDTVCQPGGILDTVSAMLINALPSFDAAEVNNDLESVMEWTDVQRDEL